MNAVVEDDTAGGWTSHRLSLPFRTLLARALVLTSFPEPGFTPTKAHLPAVRQERRFDGDKKGGFGQGSRA